MSLLRQLMSPGGAPDESPGRQRVCEAFKITRSLGSLTERYEPKRACVVNLELDVQRRITGTEVHGIPFHRLSQFILTLL